MIGIEIVIGALVTVIVQALRKLIGKIGSNLTILLVFALTLVGAALYNIGNEYVSVDFLSKWGTILSTQFTIWAVFVKYVWPKIKPEEKK
jgi:branched-subunit amino acid ABC-type transport system permease component